LLCIDSTIESSSDSELEVADPLARPLNRFGPPALANKSLKSKAPRTKSKVDKMIVQSEIDEEKLDFIRDHLKRRPANFSYTQPLPRRNIQLPSTSNTKNPSSEAVNPTGDQPLKNQHSPTPKETELLKPSGQEIERIEPRDDAVDESRSMVSSELTDRPKKTKREKLKLRLSHQPTIRKFFNSNNTLCLSNENGCEGNARGHFLLINIS
jgi:hypothetical protein